MKLAYILGLGLAVIRFSRPRGQGQGHTEVKGQIYAHRDISVSISDRANIIKLPCRLGLRLAVIRFSGPRDQGQAHTEVKGPSRYVVDYLR